MDSLPDTRQPAPGWYPDPDGTGTLRWRDGTAWTEAFQEAVSNVPPSGEAYPPEATQVPFPNGQGQMRPPFSKSAVAGFVISCVGLLIFGFIGVVGVAFSRRGLRETKQPGMRGRGLAIAGLILGAVDFIFYAVARFVLHS